MSFFENKVVLVTGDPCGAGKQAPSN